MAATPFRVKAVFEYSSGHDDDLNFPNGQIITVTDVEDDDWYFGEYTDDGGASKQGLFPKNFVEKYEPVTPPRPSRPVKKEQEIMPELPAQAATKPVQQPPAPAAPKAEAAQLNTLAQDDSEEGDEEEETHVLAPIPEASKPVSAQQQELLVSQALPVRSPPIDTHTAGTPSIEKATAPVKSTPEVSKSPLPAVAEKPAGTSFRDRIAAFNKPAAPPVAPVKPGQMQGSSFVKKPFVPPPPSRNAYVPIPKEPPPQKVYRSQEDPNLPEPINESTRPAPIVSETQEEGEDLPKPTSLKERIALLQKQQLEQAARHSEAVAKKEKPKKPPPRRTTETVEDEEALTAASGAIGQPFSDAEEEDAGAAAKPPRVPVSKDRTPIGSPDLAQRELLNDPNDADQSGGGDTEDGEPSLTQRATRAPLSRPPVLVRQQSGASDRSDPRRSLEVPTMPGGEEASRAAATAEDEAAQDEEDEDIDPEIRRRMEIRERMAKMSGGMGMAGMFGPSGGLPPLSAKKVKATSAVSTREEEATADPAAQPIPIMALPGMTMPGLTKMKSPEGDDTEAERSTTAPHISQVGVMDDSDHEEPEATQPPPPVPSGDHPARVPSIRAIPAVPSAANARAPPPPPPVESRPLPPVPPTQSQVLSAGEDSDDELSAVQETDTPQVPTRRLPPPPIPTSALSTSSETAPISPSSAETSPTIAKSSTFPLAATSSSEKRISRAPPPIPGSAAPPSSPPVGRAAPPPPPTRPVDNIPRSIANEESGEITEYEGDYDTDIAAGDSHKDALTAEQSSSADETLTGDEATYHHSGLPSLGPPPGIPAAPGVTAPRGAPPPPPPREPPRAFKQSPELPRPPPPPTQAPVRSRQSADLPRGVPPPIPQQVTQIDDDYDPYRYDSRPAIQSRPSQKSVVTPRAESQYDDLYGSSPSRTSRAPPAPPSAPPPALSPQVTATKPRQSLDVSRAVPGRTSTDGRPSMDHATGFMASEIDVGRASSWWTQRKMPPPAVQNRPDLAYEIEESTAIQQDGSDLVLKHVYVLYPDYSQTILTARFSPADPSKAEFNQRFEAPPTALRQDQLEAAHGLFGASLADIAKTKENHVVGNGTPMAFIADLLHNFPEAVPAVGARAFGAVVYTNIANSSVQQLDEIRTGDIITFRNAKMQGHKGAMKAKYNMDVGKPDHVAVIVDWDGTKKKVRAWEQGRESKKIKIESFKLGDLKSGEVKIWRVVGRDWIGWGSKS